MKLADAFQKEKLKISQSALLTTLGAAVAEVEAAVEQKSFLGDLVGVGGISLAQQALLDTIGAAFAATNFLAGQDVASDIELGFRISKDVAMLGEKERMSFGHRARGATSFVVNIITAAVAASATTQIPKGAVTAVEPGSAGFGCCYFVWDPIQKQWKCRGNC